MPILELQELKKMIPSFSGRAGNALAAFLMRMLSVDKVNDLYDRHSDLEGPDFAGAVLDDIGVEYEVKNREILAYLPEGPFITISNHPYGSIDGMMLVDLFGHLRSDYKVMVNKFLSRIETLDDNFICVTPVGEQRTSPSDDSINGIRNAVRHVRDGHPLGIFPSGAVSDFSFKEGCIRDRVWPEPVIRLIRKLNVPVLPVKFLDRNSDFYYGLGLVDWKVRLLRLPAEVFNKRGKPARIAVGELITPQKQASFADIEEFGAFLRSSVYDLM